MGSAETSPKEAASASAKAARRKTDLASLMALTESLASQDDIFDILFSVVKRLAELLNIDRGSIVLRRENDDVGIVVATSDDAAMRNHQFPLDKYPEIREVLHSGAPLVIRDVTESAILTEVLRAEGSLSFSSMALIPITGKKGPVAVLCLKSDATTNFDDYDIMHAQAVANATAIALNNARTLRRLRDQTRALSSARTKDRKRLKELSRYLDVFESSRDAMLVVDQSGQVLFANPRAARLTERNEGDLVSSSLAALLADEHAAAAREVIQGFSQGKFPTGLDFALAAPASGTISCVNFSSIVGKSEAVLVTMRDVTAERAMARELSHTKEFLERVIESSVDGIVSADLRGRVLVYNNAAARLFGYDKKDVLRKLYVHKLYPEGVARDIMRRIESDDFGGPGGLKEHRVEMLTKDGERVPVNLSASLVLDGTRTIGTVGIFTDIREKLAMEASLSEAQKQLEQRRRHDAIAEMAGAAAHELNQPLTSVMGYAEFLKRSVHGEPPLAHAIQVILTETERMADIVRKVGKVSRYETKPYVGSAKIVDLDRSSTPEG